MRLLHSIRNDIFCIVTASDVSQPHRPLHQSFQCVIEVSLLVHCFIIWIASFQSLTIRVSLGTMEEMQTFTSAFSDFA